MPVTPVPSAIGGLVVEVDVAATVSVVVIGEGDDIGLASHKRRRSVQKNRRG